MNKILIFCYAVFCIIAKVNAEQQDVWSLKTCIDSAQINNIGIRQFANGVRLSALNLKQSRNNLLPAVNGNLAQNFSMGRMINPVTEVYQTGTVWSTSVGLNFSQNLFSGLQLLNIIKENQLIYKSSKLDLEDVKFNLNISIVNAYLQVLYSKEATVIAVNQITADSLQLQTTSDLEYVGKKTESDLLQLKSQLSTDKYALVSAISQWKIAKINLQQLMDIEVSADFDIDYNTIPEPVKKQLDGIGIIYTQSLLFQPTIQSNSLKTQSAKYGLKVARGAYYPQILLKGNLGTDYSSAYKQSAVVVTNAIQNIGYLQSNPSELVVGSISQQQTTTSNYPFGKQVRDNINGTLSVGVSISILNYLQVRNNVKKQVVDISNADLNEEQVKITLRKTLEQVYTNAENSRAQYNAAAEEVKANKAAYDIAVVKYDEGKAIASDLILQKNAYIKSLSDLLQAKYSMFFNDKILGYYTGKPIVF